MPFNIIYGPTGSGKTTRAIEAFLAALSRGENPMFVAPSGPDARHFHREIIRAAGDGGRPGVLIGGAVGTFDSLCREILDAGEAPLRVISQGERLRLLRAIVDLTKLDSLAASAAFDGFVEAFAELMVELERLGAGGAQLGKTLRSWAGSDKWRQGLNKDIYRLLDRYDTVLADAGLSDPEKAQRRAVEALAADGRVLARKAVIIDGFWDFTPLQHELIARLIRPASVTVTLPYIPGHPACEALAYHYQRLSGLEGCEPVELKNRAGSRELPAPLAHLAGHLFEEAPPVVAADSSVQVLTGAGLRGQADIVAAEILKLQRQGHQLDEIAVVCRSLTPDLPVIVAALEAYGVPHELAAPMPLADTAVGKTALAVLDFAGGSRARESLFAYLRGPLADVPLAAVDDFDRRCRRYGIEMAADILMEWRIRGGRPLDEISRLTAAAAAQSAAALGSELYTTVCQLVARTGRMETDAGSRAEGVSAATLAADIPALESLKQVCQDAGRVESMVGPRGGGRRDAGAQVRELMRGIRQAAVRTPAAARNCVRLLDPHRILNQRFQTVFVCGLLERQFPSFGRVDAFFSESDRRELAAGFGLGLDSGQRRLDQERFLYFRALSRADQRVYLCYPSSDSEGKPTVRSLFADDTLRLFREKTVPARGRQVGDRVFEPSEAPTAREAVRSLAVWSRDCGEKSRRELIAADPAGLGGRLADCFDADLAPDAALKDPAILASLDDQDSFRVTGLQKHLRCPFRYFVENLLAPLEMTSPAHGLRRGQMVHSILCRFGAQMKSSQLYLSDEMTQSQIGEIRNQMRAFIAEELVDAGSGLETMILRNELEYQLDRFIDRELTSGRRLRYFDFELSFGGPGGGCGNRNNTDKALNLGEVLLTGRLDRVDWDGAGSKALVIDYKSSRAPLSQSDFAARREIQIPLYMLALKEVFGLEPVGGEYYALRGDSRGGLYLEGHEAMIGAGSGQIRQKDIIDRETFEARLESAKALALEAAAAIRAGHFDISPLDSKDCQWCGLQGICRTNARHKPETDGDV